jgi:cilia- and flagella-associated protein 298
MHELLPLQCGHARRRVQAVDAETQKAMMAWYHKKQEEQKALEENLDDTYMQASWASRQSLKAHFSGVSEVRLPH